MLISCGRSIENPIWIIIHDRMREVVLTNAWVPIVNVVRLGLPMIKQISLNHTMKYEVLVIIKRWLSNCKVSKIWEIYK